MKDIYKNPIVYYIAVPVVIGLWPLLLWSVYLADAEQSLENELAQYEKAEKVMGEILTLDPDRLKYAKSKGSAIKFDYTVALDEAAERCDILPENYKFNSKPSRDKRGEKSQKAGVALKKISIAKFANFLSVIQLRWADLKCEQAKLTKQKGLPDTWKVDIKFNYYY